MFVHEVEAPRLGLIDRLLQNGEYGLLEQVTIDEVGKGLLSRETLDAARALRLPATVIYLATLGQENLDDAQDRPMWLAVYQSIGRGIETEAFTQLNERSAVKWMARQAMPGRAPDAAVLRRCQGDLSDWLAAAELAVDQNRFDALETLVQEGVRRKWAALEWLNLTRLLVVRHQMLERQMELAPLARSYARIRELLPTHSAALVNTRSRLALNAGQCFFWAGDYFAAIAQSSKATASQDTLARSFELAKAYCHAGDLPMTLQWLDRIIEQVSDAQRLMAFKANRDQQAEEARQPGHQFDPEQASQALVALQRALDKVEKKAFLVSGTLLGYAREGRLLAHDKDVDVGIIGWENQYDVVDALLQSGQFAIDANRIGGARTYHIPVKHLDTQVSIDIFIYHHEGGRLVTGVQSYFGYLQKFAFTPFDLAQVRFLGIDFHVPCDVERNLAENFGDWRVSDPGYISHLESPSTVEVGGLVYQVVGRLRALEAIRAGNLDKLSRVIKLMHEHRDNTGGMSGETLRLLGRIHDSLQAEEAPEVAAC